MTQPDRLREVAGWVMHGSPGSPYWRGWNDGIEHFIVALDDDAPASDLLCDCGHEPPHYARPYRLAAPAPDPDIPTENQLALIRRYAEGIAELRRENRQLRAALPGPDAEHDAVIERLDHPGNRANLRSTSREADR